MDSRQSADETQGSAPEIDAADNLARGDAQPSAVDLEEARRFLSALDPTTDHYCFQSFDDGGEDRSLARTLHGTFTELAATLARLNERGAGTFITINEIVYRMPRTAQNVIRVRALFIDNDDAAKATDIEEKIGHYGLPPSIVVESSPGKFHHYWLVKDCPLERFKPAQQALAARFGTDPAVCDLPRVMRLPGFVHHKRAPFRSRIVRIEQ